LALLAVLAFAIRASVFARAALIAAPDVGSATAPANDAGPGTGTDTTPDPDLTVADTPAEAATAPSAVVVELDATAAAAPTAPPVKDDTPDWA